MSVQITGVEPVRAELRRLQSVTSTKGRRRAMRLAVGLLHRTATAIVPVDTGRLKGSIFQRVVSRGRGVTGLVATSGVKYAPYVENRVKFFQRTARREADTVRRIFVDAIREGRA